MNHIRRFSQTTAKKVVKIVEVGPRDGLQNEPLCDRLTTDVKVELIKKLVAAGLKTIEAGSFVSSKWVPQMANSGQVLKSLEEYKDVTFPVLVPNLHGLEQVLDIKDAA